MLETLRAWLNGKKEYYTGVALYAQLGSNTALLNLFTKGATDYNTRRLQQELLAICEHLKQNQDVYANNPNKCSPEAAGSMPVGRCGNNQNDEATGKGKEGNEEITSLHEKVEDLENENEDLQEKVEELEDTVYDLEDQVHDLEKKQVKEPANKELYDAAKSEADKKFKQTMNDRAVLFSMINSLDDYEDPNTPDKIDARAKLALSIIQGYQTASQLYDRADYVKEHGRLPDQDDNEEECEYDHLPDLLVKQTLDNLRKNYNKMKKREQTPERVALQQKHQANIEKLLKRWHSLN